VAVFVPNHLTTLPSLSNAGVARKETNDTRHRNGVGVLQFHLARQKPERIASNPQVGSVVRVKSNLPAPITRLFGREPGIVEPALIEEVSGAVRTSGPGERGDRVNHQANILRLQEPARSRVLRMSSRNYRWS